MSGTRTDTAGRLPALVHALVTLLAIGSVWSIDYLPTHDGPQHIYALHAAQHLDDAATGYGRFLEPNIPITSHGFELVFTPFDAWLPWRTATQMALSCLLLAWCVGTFWLARAVEPRRAWIGVVLAALAFQWDLYMGMFSYYLATALGLCILAIALAAEPWSRARRMAVAGLLLVQALMHVMAAAITGGVLLTLALLRAPRAGRARALVRICATGLPASGVALAMLVAGFDGMARASAGATPDWHWTRPPLWSLASCFAGGPAWRSGLPLLLAITAPWAAWRVGGRHAFGPRERALLVAGSIGLGLAALTPLHLPAWNFFSMRFLPASICCLALLWPLERLAGERARAVASLALAVAALASTVWALDYNQRLAAHTRDALAGLDVALPRDGARLPIIFEPFYESPLEPQRAAIPYFVPLANLGQLYATAQGGYVPNSFALSWQIHPVLLRADARRHFPPTVDRSYAFDLAKPGLASDDVLRAAITAYLGAIGTRYQDVIVWGRPEDGDRLIEMGYEPDFRRGGLLLAHFRGCPLSLRFPPETPPPPHTQIELGWLPAWHVTHRYAVDKAPPDARGARTLALVGPPCTGVFVSLSQPKDGSAGLECAGADAEGRLIVASVRETPRVECRLRRRSARASRASRAAAREPS
jgi:hypothetical protein